MIFNLRGQSRSRPGVFCMYNGPPEMLRGRSLGEDFLIFHPRPVVVPLGGCLPNFQRLGHTGLSTSRHDFHAGLFGLARSGPVRSVVDRPI